MYIAADFFSQMRRQLNVVRASVADEFVWLLYTIVTRMTIRPKRSDANAGYMARFSHVDALSIHLSGEKFAVLYQYK